MTKKVRNFEAWLKDYLIQELNIPNLTVEAMLKEAAENKVPLHSIVIDKSIIQTEDAYRLASSVLVHEIMPLSNFTMDPNLKILSKKSMERYNAIPISYSASTKELVLATSNPTNLIAIDEIKRETKANVKTVFSLQQDIRMILEESSTSLNELMENINLSDLNIQEEKEEEEQVQSEEEPLIVKMVNSIFNDAIEAGASDVHIEPQEHSIRVRFRIDGVLVEKIGNLDRKLLSTFVSRIKIMSGMDISEQRRPQDGSFKTKTSNGTVVDFRTSTMITQFGEKVVVRLTPRKNIEFNLDNIGFSEEEKEKIIQIMNTPYGLMLVTGPTGSGKTNTLYGVLGELNTVEKNIITIEDPIERDIRGINQTQINPKANISFSSGLKTSLRQDPDVIMVGEIRDHETAETTIQGALTGHLVLSTLHTNDSVSAVTRLKDMGVEAYKIPSALIAVIAQRLIRVNCTHCIEEYPATKEEVDLLKVFSPSQEIPAELTLKRGLGCKNCNHTGYSGRTPVFEILLLNDEIKDLVSQDAKTKEIKEAALRNGLITMQDSAVSKVLSGATTTREIQRVVFLIR